MTINIIYNAFLLPNVVSRGFSSVVERSLRMRDVRGSIPLTSTFFFFNLSIQLLSPYNSKSHTLLNIIINKHI